MNSLQNGNGQSWNKLSIQTCCWINEHRSFHRFTLSTSEKLVLVVKFKNNEILQVSSPFSISNKCFIDFSWITLETHEDTDGKRLIKGNVWRKLCRLLWNFPTFNPSKFTCDLNCLSCLLASLQHCLVVVFLPWFGLLKKNFNYKQIMMNLLIC